MTIVNSILSQCGVCKDKLPSFYHMTKQRPKFVEMQLNVQILPARLSHLKKLRYQPILEKAASSQPNVVNKPVLVGTLEGGYEVGIKMVLKKITQGEFDEIIGNKEEPIIINSYNGVEHSKKHKSKTSSISFSSQVLNEKVIQELGYSTASPNNILTWV